MKSINELRTMRANAWNDAKNYIDTHTREDGTMSAEDVKQYEKLEQKIMDIGAEITRMEKLRDIDDEMSKPTSKPIFLNPGSGIEHKSGTASDVYKEAMLNAIRTNFRHVSNVLQTGIDSAGGFLIPDEYERDIIQALEDENIMRKLGTTITTSGPHKLNIAANKPAAAWVEEGEALTFSDATFNQIVLDAHKLCVGVKVTEELLADNAFNLERYIINAFARALGNAEEDAFLNGDGVNRPTGIFHPEKGGQVSVTASSVNIKADEILDLIYSLARPFRKNSCLIMHDSTLAQIRKLKDGNGQYLWQPSLQAGEPERVCGVPVYTSAYCPVAEAGKPVMAYGDFSYYYVADRQGRTLSELKELFAVQGIVAFCLKERTEGRVILPEAIKIMKIKA